MLVTFWRERVTAHKEKEQYMKHAQLIEMLDLLFNAYYIEGRISLSQYNAGRAEVYDLDWESRRFYFSQYLTVK